jgi:hypothetical protein
VQTPLTSHKLQHRWAVWIRRPGELALADAGDVQIRIRIMESSMSEHEHFLVNLCSQAQKVLP